MRRAVGVIPAVRVAWTCSKCRRRDCLCPVYCLKRADMGMVLVRRSTKYRRGAITAPCFSDIEVLAEIFTERWIGTR